MRQFPHFLPGICCNCAASYENKRSFGSIYEFCRFFQRLLLYFLNIRLHRLWCVRKKFCHICGNILGNIHQHRSRSAAFGNNKGSADGFCQFGYIFYNKTMFGNGHHYPCNIHFLEAVLSKKGQSYITGNGYYRNGIHIGCGNSRNQVGCSRTAGCQTHPYFSCGTCVAIRCMGCSLFMGSQHMMDFLLMLI